MAIIGVPKLKFTFLNILLFMIIILSSFNFYEKIVFDFFSDKQFRYSDVSFRKNLTLKNASQVETSSQFKTTTITTTTMTTTTPTTTMTTKTITTTTSELLKAFIGSEKLYLIVPYRDREENMKVFIDEMKTFLNKKVLIQIYTFLLLKENVEDTIL